MNNITFKQYRNIDLTIFAVLLALSEAITTVATNKWFYAQPVAISTTLIFICIIMMRWGGFAAIHAVLGGLVFCVASGASAEQFLVYAVGNCAALSGLIWLRVFGKDKVRVSAARLMLFVATSYLTMQLGRWLISLPFGARPDTLLVYLTTDIVSLLFAAVVMVITSKLDGVIEDQKSYLFRLQREKEEQSAPAQPIDLDEE